MAPTWLDMAPGGVCDQGRGCLSTAPVCQPCCGSSLIEHSCIQEAGNYIFNYAQVKTNPNQCSQDSPNHPHDHAVDLDALPPFPKIDSTISPDRVASTERRVSLSCDIVSSACLIRE